MTQHHNLTKNHDKNSDSMNWQRILEFGAETIKAKVKKRSQQTHKSVFIVLP